VPVTVDHRLIAAHNDAVPATLELDDAEKTALIALLKQTIAVDPFPMSQRSRTFKAIIAKLEPTPRKASTECVSEKCRNERKPTQRAED
jgi:tellurite resistance protein